MSFTREVVVYGIPACDVVACILEEQPHVLADVKR